MRLEELDLPAKLVSACAKKGISELYPPQTECVKKGLLEGKNLLISIPTASGKTLVAEMAMHHHVASRGKCLYVVPLKALASEKYEEFSGKGPKIGIATGDFDKRDEYLGRNDIVIATSEKVDSLLRNNTPWMSNITCLILDEAHLIDSEDRGATLEMVITKLRHLNENLQMIGLTATIGNPGALASWLGAELVTSDWRPVDLKEGVFCRDTLYFGEEIRPIETPKKNDDENLCIDCVNDGGQCLVFVNSRRNAEGCAKRMATALKLDEPELEKLAEELEKAAETDMGRILATCVKKGAAFHHAGMKRNQREIVERGFRQGSIRVISSTPTLAAGLNLPARRVIIRDYLRFKGGEGMVPIPVREYRQMAGRAGRPHLDPYGEAILIAKGPEVANGLYEEFISAPAEDVTSRLDDERVLTGQILSLISTGFVKTKEGLPEFLNGTFYVHMNKSTAYIDRIVEDAVLFLEDAGMITRTGEFLSATEYGHLVSRLYITPRTAEVITGALRERSGRETGAPPKEFSDLGFLQVLCTTPDMYTLYIKKSDMDVLERFYFENEDELWEEISFDSMEEGFRALKTAMLVNDWISEAGEDLICSRYGVGPGDIYNTVEGMNWLLHASSRLSSMLVPEFRDPVRETGIRVQHGIKRELLPLVRLKGIGRVRARRLFNNNILSPEDLTAAGFDRVAAIVGRKIARQIMDQASGAGAGFSGITGGRKGRVAEDEDQDGPSGGKTNGNGQSSIFSF
ncbi:MAG: ATP-dependent DNA helicase [Methanomicrobiaceae archaeon]|nr:ATP-dependent DNA helicase [Methanomicrobiaceae archaeon]